MKCNHNLKKVEVSVQDADSPVTSYQCGKCGYFDFEEHSIHKKKVKRFMSPFPTKDILF